MTTKQNLENASRQRSEFFKRSTLKVLHEASATERTFIVGTGLCLAFSAGISNGTSLSGFLTESGTTQSVTGVTGTYTDSAISLGTLDRSQFRFDFGVIGSVLFGSFLAGVMNPCAVPFELAPKFVPTFMLASLFMTAGAIDASFDEGYPRRAFYFTAMANGLQNGISSIYSANLIRTTHLTGTTTDIGLLLGQILRGNRANQWKLGILVGLAVVFWVGSLVGFFLSRKVHSLALVYNAAFFFLIGVSLTYHNIKRHDITLWQALIGTGKFGTMLKHLTAVTESGNEVSDSELMELFDDLDEDGDAYIDQDELFLALNGKYDHIIKQKKNFFRILEDAWNESSDAGKGWKLSREDWRRLVDQHSSSSRHVRFSEPVLKSYGPASIRQASIAMMTQAGYVVSDDDIDDEKFDESEEK